MYKKVIVHFVFVFFCSFFITIGFYQLIEKVKCRTIPRDVLLSEEFRAQRLNNEMCDQLQGKTKVGTVVGEYLLQSIWEYRSWQKDDAWTEYQKYIDAIWNDVKFFPVPEYPGQSGMGVSYVDTWMAERTYGGKRGHEGTDIMAEKNQRGLYPIISMTDGTVTNMGWLEKGGYRIGITAPSGAYFYYAHLDSYSHIEIGDQVKAGDVLGFMGDSGYGKEGTVGQFAVHLHLGIYIYLDGKEMSVNPYWVLRYIENKRVKCYTRV